MVGIARIAERREKVHGQILKENEEVMLMLKSDDTDYEEGTFYK